MGKGRAPCCDKIKVKRGPWSTEEDFRLITFIRNNGHPWNWRALPTQAGLLRCGKSCRLRWINYLRPDLKRGNFTEEEEGTIIKLHQSLGNRWSKIASYLPGRTDNEIKNVWNTRLKKRLANYCDNESKRISRTSSFNSSSTTSFSISSNLSNGHLNSISAQTDGSIPIEEEEEDDDSFNLGAYEANNKSLDFWDILEPNFQFHDHDLESSQSSKFGEENGEIFNWQKRLRDLENELGLEPTRDFGSG